MRVLVRKYTLSISLKEEINERKLRILPMWWKQKVTELYEYIELPIKNELEQINWKIYCLIDTDSERHKEYINDWYNTLKLRRLSNKWTNWSTELLTLNNGDTNHTDVERSLNPVVFKEVINLFEIDEKYKVSTIIDWSENTDFIKTFRNIDMEEFFQENMWMNKIWFATEYVNYMGVLESLNPDIIDNYMPERIKTIKSYFNE